MKAFLRRVVLAGCFVTACCFMCHCGVRQSGVAILETTESANEAMRLLRAISSTNAQVNAIKGIGSVKIWQGHQFSTFRAAWIGSRPRKFRMEILAATGQPMLSFASDGKRHYLLSHADNRIYRRKASESGLKRLVSIAINPEDILDLLTGRMPVHPEGRAAIEHRDGDSALMLVLETPNGGGREIVFPEMNPEATFYEMERYDRRGKLKFRAAFEKMRNDEGVRIPEILTIKNGNGAMMQVTVERCWVNPAVSEDRFVLQSAN